MTRPAITEHAHPREWRAALRAKGYRLTPQREQVLHAVESLGHATPDQVLAAVRQLPSSMSVSTVYRNLELLEQLGLVHHTHLTDRAPTYHATTPPDHGHLVCRDCGAVTEVAPAEVQSLAAALEARYDFGTDIGHLTIFGTCGRCRRQTADG